MLRIILGFLTVLILCSGCKNMMERHFGDARSARADSTSGYAQVNGIKMYYEIHGKGVPLVLIHGGGSTVRTTFGYILPKLAKHCKVIAVELQAHGHSSDRNTPETFEQDADDVAALLQQLNIEKADVFGFSNGGTTALQLALRHPASVDRLVLASTLYQRDGIMPGFFDAMQHASLDNMPKPLQDAFLAINNNRAALQNMHDKDKARMIAFKDIPDTAILSIQSRTLVINADKDVITNDHAVKFSRTLPNAHLLIVPGTHGSYIGEITTAFPGSKIPELVTGAILEFLK